MCAGIGKYMREKFQTTQLKWKVFTFLLLFCALLLFVFWFFQTILLKDTYKMIRKKEMDKAITLVREQINSPDLQTLFQSLEDEKEIIITPASEFKFQIKQKGDGRDKMKQETLTKTEVFVLADGSEVSYTFHAMITPVQATVSTLQVQLYFILGIMVILAIFLALLIAGWVSKPMEEINKSAKQLAKGQYDTRFYAKGFLEIKELSDTLNTAAEELSKVEGLRRELLANISHDLRTPLSLIYSYAEMMHDFPEEITKEQTQTIMDETKRLTTLVQDVFEISKLETGTEELNITEFSLTMQLSDTLMRMKELLSKEGYLFCFEFEEFVTVKADEVKIAQVFYNLLINAVHYSGTKKRIVVRQKKETDRVTIEVIDTGEGIAKENLPLIWDRYYKVDKTHKRAVTGTGLGLSIVKKIMELHQGEYGVFSEEGKGSTFYFSLKIEEPAPVC